MDKEIIVLVAMCWEGTQDIIEEFDTMREAKRYAKENGYKSVEYWYLASVEYSNGDLAPAYWDKDRRKAIAKQKAELKSTCLSKSGIKAVEKFSEELNAFAVETGESEATLYEDEVTSFTLSEVRIDGIYLCYRYDGREEKELVVKYDEEEGRYYEDTTNGVSEYIKFWKRCLKRARKYWEMNGEDIDSMQEAVLNGEAYPNQGEEED